MFGGQKIAEQQEPTIRLVAANVADEAQTTNNTPRLNSMGQICVGSCLFSSLPPPTPPDRKSSVPRPIIAIRRGGGARGESRAYA